MLIEKIKSSNIQCTLTAIGTNSIATAAMMKAGADHLVLGCTHYPFLISAIEKISQGSMTIIDPAPAVVHQLCSLLKEEEVNSSHEQPLIPPQYRFYTTGSDSAFQACVNAVVGTMTNAKFFSDFDLS